MLWTAIYVAGFIFTLWLNVFMAISPQQVPMAFCFALVWPLYWLAVVGYLPIAAWRW